MTLNEGLAVLHLDAGINDALVLSLVNAIPDYIEVTTGMGLDQQKEEPLVSVVSGFLLTLWYYADHADEARLQRTINSLLACITLKVVRS